MARVLDLKKWKKFLKSHNLKHIRTEGDHEIWDYEDDSLPRPVVFSKNKEIGIFQMGTNLQTLGLNMSDLDEWLGRGKKKKE